MYFALGTPNPCQLSDAVFAVIATIMARHGCILNKKGEITVGTASDGLKMTVDGTVKWKESTIEWVDGTLPDGQIVTEVAWELFELNFREELLMLDELMCETRDEDERLKRIGLITECFQDSPCSTMVAIPPTIPIKDQGLASKSSKHRRRFIFALANVMLGWVGRATLPAALIDFGSSTVEINEIGLYWLEKAIAGFYCQTFYDIQGRPPSIPHLLYGKS